MSIPPQQTTVKRQAVIVIHGIGEQQPMDTLREFADNILDTEKDSNEPAYYSKPDGLSQNFELRRLTTRGDTHPRTDFFEFYWAHLMPKAGWTGIFDWVWLMMNRSVRDVPLQFQGIWWILWLSLATIVISTITSVIYAIFHPQDWVGMPLKLPFGIAVIVLFGQGLFLSYIGDAATYLSPRPKNISARHAIRSTGVELLEKIHKSGKYDRIIIVGHSLGSVIGYDMLNFTWHRYQEQHGSPENPKHTCLEKAARLAATLHKKRKMKEETPKDLRDEWSSLAREVGEELRSNKHHWLVTDFVTLGSPLAHADLLLAQSRRDMDRKIKQREIPISPPVLDIKDSFSIKTNYKLPDESQRTMFVPHHAAWTACVRWTNLYFPCYWLLKGDFVGGPLSPLFGSGINDVPVSTKIGGGWFTHTYYWKRDKRDRNVTDAPVKKLQLALDLGIWFND